MGSPRQLVGELWLVERRLADDEPAIPDELSRVSALDRQQTEPLLGHHGIVHEARTKVGNGGVTVGVNPPH